jgi:hypothetical protein
MAIKIPFYESQVGMTPEAAGTLMPQPAALPMAPMQSVEEAGIPGRQLARTGDQLLNVSTEVSTRLNHARAINDFADMNLKMHLGLNQLANEVQQDTGAPETWPKKYEEGAEKLRQEVTGLTSNPLAQTSFNKIWSTSYPAKLQEVAAKSRIQDSRNFAAGFEERFPQFVELYAQADDDLARAKIKSTVDNYILQAVGAGILNPEKGAEARIKFIPEAIKMRVLQEAQADPAGVLERLKDPEKNYPGLAPGTVLTLSGTANAQLHRVQNDNYSRYMQNIYGATADNPVQGAVMPTEAEILPQMGKTLSVPGAQNILAYVRGQKENRENTTDPQSYKEAATRLTDPDNPLTREEFLKNVETGNWKFKAETYGTFLSQIQSRGAKLDKVPDSAFKAELAFQKTQFSDQFGIGKEYYQNAVGQAWAAKNEGTLGTTAEEVKANLKEIFNNQMRTYQQDLNMGKAGPKKKTGWFDNIFSGGQSGPAPAGTAIMPGAPGSIRNDKGWMSNDIRGSK